MHLENWRDYLKDIVYVDTIKRNKEFDKVAKIHKYWSRKPWYLIQKSILEYSKEGDVILDPFLGSGTVALEAILANRKAVGYDLNPFAVYLSNCLVNDLKFDNELYLKELHQIENFAREKILPDYKYLDYYILYWFSGSKKPSDYNAILTDSKFKKRIKNQVPDETLNEKFKIYKSYPTIEFPKRFYKDRFSYKGYSTVSDFYSSRNLKALSELRDHIETSSYKYKDYFILAFTNTVLHVSYLKGKNVRPLGVNNYWIPDDHIQENVVWRYLDRAKNLLIAKNSVKERVGITLLPEAIIYNKSSLELAEIADSSIDYVITDPPYGDVIQYSELSFIWNSWLNLEYDSKDEVIINPKQDKGEEEFLSSLELFVKNTKRVLKTGAKFTLCFQNKKIGIWYSILESILESGFKLHDIKVYETLGSTFNQNWAKFSPNNDIYVTFIKEEKVEKKQISNILVDVLYDEIKRAYADIGKDHTEAVKYDLFVAGVIRLLFDGVKIENVKKLTLKGIVNQLFDNQDNGTRKKGNNTNIQTELQF
jgi:DNA modification methylase